MPNAEAERYDQERDDTSEAEVIAFPGGHRAAGTTVTEVPTTETAPDEVVQGEITDARPRPSVALRPEFSGSARVLGQRAAQVARRPDRLAGVVLRHELVYGGIGAARATGAAWRWVTARELDQQLATNPKLVLDTRRARRMWAAGVGGATAAAGAASWVLLSPAVPILVLLLVLAVTGADERRRRALGAAEAGHQTLGANPSGKEVKKALVSAKLAKSIDDLRIVGPVTRTDGAWEANVELPPGTTFKHATKRRGELAGAMGVDEVQVALDPVKGHHGRVKLWVADEDPMQGERIVNPLTLTRDGRVDIWRDKLFAGRDPRGREVAFSMVERSYLIGGEPGGGKSVASNNVLGFFFLDPRVQVYLADGKFGFDLMAWEPLAAGVLTDRRQDAMLAYLEHIQTEMDRRYALLRKLGVPKITEQIAKKHNLHPIVLHIDEVQYWTAGADKKTNDAIMILIADIVGRGRAAGIITGVITQRPAAEVVPTRLRDILSIRWALRCTTPMASDTILGSGWAGRGYSAALFEPDQRGAGYVLAEGGTPTQTRAAFIDPERGELQQLADRAHSLREEAGTLPKTADRPEVRLLSALLEAMGDTPKGAHTADLLPALAKVSSEYADWDAGRLSTTLRPLGVTPVQLDIDGRNRNGYRRSDIQAALERA
ncbi:hypothetical protein F4561_005607 [Lipingzhangella halophila]|uniref:FtsK domain-containing protein n=1 Tax=Lipingzhangella halophila TaxID=1783352 RepID=A0A7W7RMG2_9ACTN|nr:FtsK/SpoIIIE domain-containing protein [Lipingzhangella halophila]MBB4929191.1 hypothetical protein [Lipingzhangella halophila]MBB4934713.1 hypothetical protein [Lipingzhangella halophila]